MSIIFVDSGAFYALADEDDERHQSAESFYKKAYKPNLFVTSNYVFVESWTLIHHKLGRTAARRFWETIRAGIVALENVTKADLDKAWHVFNKYSDHDLSLVDCTSFALMERLGISQTFSFDIHFTFYRTAKGESFTCLPEP